MTRARVSGAGARLSREGYRVGAHPTQLVPKPPLGYTGILLFHLRVIE